MNRNKRYTEKEDKVIMEEIDKSPDNLQNAFHKAAMRLRGRHPSSISSRYYTQIKKENSIFNIHSSKKCGNNVKNKIRVKSTGDISIPVTLDMLDEMINQLTLKDRVDLISRHIS